MTPKEAVEKIKSMIFGDEEKQMGTPVPAEPQSFMEYKLKSGAVVSIDKLEVGGSVTLNGEPAPDGEHEFEDGSKIVVSGGLITEVKKAENAPIVEVEVEAMKKLPGMFSDMQQGFASAKNDIAELKQTIADQKNTIAKQSETLKQMFSLVETIANSSVQSPAEPVKGFDELSPLEKFRAQKNF
jgi:uncharacterized coiled-coil protein SlyX